MSGDVFGVDFVSVGRVSRCVIEEVHVLEQLLHAL
jgi:hypothetical protein